MTTPPMGISKKKTQAPSTHSLQRTKPPPHHKEMVTPLASEIEKASNPHYPVKLFKCATQALAEALTSKRRAPLPLKTHHAHTTHGIGVYTWHFRSTITRGHPTSQDTSPRHTTPTHPKHIRTYCANTKTPLTNRTEHDHCHRRGMPPMPHGRLCVLPLRYVQVLLHTPATIPRHGTTPPVRRNVPRHTVPKTRILARSRACNHHTHLHGAMPADDPTTDNDRHLEGRDTRRHQRRRC